MFFPLQNQQFIEQKKLWNRRSFTSTLKLNLSNPETSEFKSKSDRL